MNFGVYKGSQHPVQPEMEYLLGEMNEWFKNNEVDAKIKWTNNPEYSLENNSYLKNLAYALYHEAHGNEYDYSNTFEVRGVDTMATNDPTLFLYKLANPNERGESIAYIGPESLNGQSRIIVGQTEGQDFSLVCDRTFVTDWSIKNLAEKAQQSLTEKSKEQEEILTKEESEKKQSFFGRVAEKAKEWMENTRELINAIVERHEKDKEQQARER